MADIKPNRGIHSIENDKQVDKKLHDLDDQAFTKKVNEIFRTIEPKKG